MDITKTLNPNLIMEIGSNDGSFVKNFDKKKVICVEPCSNVAKITQKMGYKTFINFWNMKLAKKIKSKIKNVDLIYTLHQSVIGLMKMTFYTINLRKFYHLFVFLL